MRIKATTVAHETAAVSSFTAPERRYHGCQKIVASMRCPVPHARMNAPKSQKIGGNGRVLPFWGKKKRATGNAAYPPKNAPSGQTRTQPCREDQIPQGHLGR